MNRQDEWLRAYVEKCLRDQWGVEVFQDDDGDFCFRHGTAACYVRIEGGPVPLVRVFAHAVVDVKRSARLLVELNQVNERSRTAHAYWAAGSVIVEQALHVKGVEPRRSPRHALPSAGSRTTLGCSPRRLSTGGLRFRPTWRWLNSGYYRLRSSISHAWSSTCQAMRRAA